MILSPFSYIEVARDRSHDTFVVCHCMGVAVFWKVLQNLEYRIEI